MKLNDFFDKIFVINLERRPDRLEEFRQKADKIGFDFEVFSAVDGKKIDEDFVYNGKQIKITPNQFYFGGFDNYAKSQLGCLISHLGVLKLAKERGYKRFLVLEDDCDFTEDFVTKFSKFCEEFDREWDMFYFSGSMPETSESWSTYRRLISCHTTHSYAVNSRCLDYLIEFTESNINTMPIDSNYTQIQSKLECYIAFPFLTYQAEGFSDIQNIVVDYDSIKKYL
jgi:GR25 family glycosyltransferase involved in LPS biosynthesis